MTSSSHLAGRQFLQALVILTLSAFALVEQGLSGALAVREYFPPPDSAGGWRTTTNAAPAGHRDGLLALYDGRLQRGGSVANRRRNGKGLSVDSQAGTKHSRPRHVVAALRDVDECGSRLFLFVAGAAHRVDGAAARHRN